MIKFEINDAPRDIFSLEFPETTRIIEIKTFIKMKYPDYKEMRPEDCMLLIDGTPFFEKSS